MQVFAKVALFAAFLCSCGNAGSAQAEGMMQRRTVAAYRVELHVLPAEPFFGKKEVAEKHVKEGMEVEDGATPVALDADSHPNHHLVVHIFRRRTGAIVTDARVTMSFVPIDGKGRPAGAPTDVPVVVMQAIGVGPTSTHYGNNVTMLPGRYDVTVNVNDKRLVFPVTVSDAPVSPMEMNHMKM
jgi:hypothetical protein